MENFYIADANQGGVIWKLTVANMDPDLPFAASVPGTNGIAFDRSGNLWTGDGTTGQGRVWKITPEGDGDRSVSCPADAEQHGARRDCWR